MKAFVILMTLATILCGTPGFQFTARSQAQEKHPGTDGEVNQDKRSLRIEFEGNRFVSSQELTETMTRCLEPAFKAEGKYTSELGEYCSNYEVLSFVRSKGYLQAVVSKPERLETEHGLKLVMNVKEGLLYRVGEIKVQGAEVFPSKQIIESLGLTTGEIMNGEALEDALYKRLKKAYADEGHIQYDYEVTPEFKASSSGEANEGMVDLKITISEGQQFLIRRIEFAGNERTPDDVLRRKLLMREGRIFNQELYEKSFKRLNELGLFEEITEKDITRRSNKETPELDILIQVKEKEPF
ncbi:MAG TPA: POTRA domain-containing protein [Pyrinomonadaceae bacterium]|jgi:outer membrane protein assembly factor BamA|nr:POTRA domain-containing protein [Pyrinomonadaceae bacterium]